jgi:hypothetical protein
MSLLPWHQWAVKPYHWAWFTVLASLLAGEAVDWMRRRAIARSFEDAQLAAWRDARIAVVSPLPLAGVVESVVASSLPQVLIARVSALDAAPANLLEGPESVARARAEKGRDSLREFCAAQSTRLGFAFGVSLDTDKDGYQTTWVVVMDAVSGKSAVARGPSVPESVQFDAVDSASHAVKLAWKQLCA